MYINNLCPTFRERMDSPSPKLRGHRLKEGVKFGFEVAKAGEVFSPQGIFRARNK